MPVNSKRQSCFEAECFLQDEACVLYAKCRVGRPGAFSLTAGIACHANCVPIKPVPVSQCLVSSVETGEGLGHSTVMLKSWH